ncbi:2-deoxy-scyllo-inosamine dehydrogenase OS=Streptomyces tendae OX=1932 GN=F3L20_23060 PE=3 SV=1 [Streptomyces tendae]
MPDPTPGPREVVVEVAACGLCGTDLHILQGEFAPSFPIVPGHDSPARWSASAPRSPRWRSATRWPWTPPSTAAEFRYCRTGHNNLCERWAAIGVTTAGGAACTVAPA